MRKGKSRAGAERCARSRRRPPGRPAGSTPPGGPPRPLRRGSGRQAPHPPPTTTAVAEATRCGTVRGRSRDAVPPKPVGTSLASSDYGSSYLRQPSVRSSRGWVGGSRQVAGAQLPRQLSCESARLQVSSGRADALGAPGFFPTPTYHGRAGGRDTNLTRRNAGAQRRIQACAGGRDRRGHQPHAERHPWEERHQGNRGPASPLCGAPMGTGIFAWRPPRSFRPWARLPSGGRSAAWWTQTEWAHRGGQLHRGPSGKGPEQWARIPEGGGGARITWPEAA